MMATTQCTTQGFLNFLKSRKTGLKQRSRAWVSSRKSTIGASEVAALIGASPFENEKSLLFKKAKTQDMTNMTACTWGNLFEPISRKYFEQKHNTSVFAHSISLNLAKDHPLYGKITCSPDGYFKDKDGNFILLEFKCPFKRKIAVRSIPRYYVAQLQTGLAFSGDMVRKGLFVDSYFRLCPLKKLSSSTYHNAALNGGTVHSTKVNKTLAWGIVYLFSRQLFTKNQTDLVDVAEFTQTEFDKVMAAIEEKELWCSYGPIRTDFSKEVTDEEFLRQQKFRKELSSNTEGPRAVAYLTWKLLDITELPITQHDGFLAGIQERAERFHRQLDELRKKIHLIIEPTSAAVEQTNVKPTPADDSAMLEAFLNEISSDLLKPCPINAHF